MFIITLFYFLLHTPHYLSDEVLGAGASFPQTLYENAITAYKSQYNDEISYHTMGSGRGRCRIKSWEDTCASDDRLDPRYIDFAGSDSILTPEDYHTYPDLQMYPVVAGAVAVVYNIPGISSTLESRRLVLSKEVVAQIFRGEIRYWNDTRIRSTQNSFVKDRLPDAPIEIVVRSDSSGTTQIFKSALSFFDSAFNTSIGSSSSSLWHGVNVSKVDGNSGVAAYVLFTPFTIGYTVLSEANQLDLPVIGLGQNSGSAVFPTLGSVTAALLDAGSQFGNNGDDPEHMTANLFVTQSSNAWPLCGYTYLVMRKETLREGGTHSSRLSTSKFWNWFYRSGVVREIAAANSFAMLPDSVRDIVLGRFNRDIKIDGNAVHFFVPLQVPPVLDIFFKHIVVPAYGNIDAISPILSVVSLNESYSNNDIVITFKSHADILLSSNHNTVGFNLATYSLAVVVNLCGNFHRSQCPFVSSPPVQLDILTLGAIFAGKITNWGDISITSRNKHLVGVDETIVIVSDSRHSLTLVSLKSIFESIVPEFEYCENCMCVESNENRVKAKVYNTAFSIAVLSNLGLLGPQASPVTLVNADTTSINRIDSPRSVRQGVFSQCTGSNCYPLSVALSVVTTKEHKDCELSDDDVTVKRVRFLSWVSRQSEALKSLGFTPLGDTGEVESALKSITCHGESILDVNNDRNLLPTSLVTGLLSLMYIVATVVLACIAVLVIKRREKDVRLWQPFYLYVLLLGCLITLSAIIPMSMDDRDIKPNSDGSYPVLDHACMATPWLYFIGCTMMYMALLIRVWRLICLSSTLKRATVRTSDMLPYLLFPMMLSIVVLFTWQVYDPLRWVRVAIEFDSEGNTTSSRGKCSSDSMSLFLFALFSLVLGLLMYGQVLCFKARNIAAVISDSKWLSAALSSSAQALYFSIPVFYFIKKNPTAAYFVKVMSVLAQVSFVVGCMLFPKIFHLFVRTHILVIPNEDCVAYPCVRHESDKSVSTSTCTLDHVSSQKKRWESIVEETEC